MGEHFGRDMNLPSRRADYTFTPSIEYNRHLLQSVVGLITPLSTLALEAALVGTPILEISFFEEGEWLRHALEHSEHLRRMRDEVPGVLICREESRFIEDVGRLIAVGGDSTLAARMRASVRPIVYSDERTTYAERLADVVAALIGAERPASPVGSAPTETEPPVTVGASKES